MRTYYNDNDPHCCQVIRKNIHLGFLPEGHVDERTIQDVTWEDIAPYQHVHLFAGIAGFPLGMRWAGYPLWLRTMTGGFPCTDLSVAGKRAGLQGEASGLWAEMARLIRTSAEHDIWYDYILIENVPGLLSGGHYDEETTQEAAESDAVKDGSLCPTDSGSVGDATDESVFQSWMGIILADLAQAGYDATWTVLRASDFGAPHRRERVFIVAHPDRERPSSIGNGLPTRKNTPISPSGTSFVADTTSTREATAQQQRFVYSSQSLRETVAHPQCSTSRMEGYRGGGQGWQFTDTPQSTPVRQEHGATGPEGIRADGADVADATSQQDRGLQQRGIFTNTLSSSTRDVADPNGYRQWNGTYQSESRSACEGASDARVHGELQPLADSNINQCDRNSELQTGWNQVSEQRNLWANSDRCTLLADSAEQGLPERRRAELATSDTQSRTGMESEPQRCGEMADTDRERCEECNASAITDAEGHLAWRTRAPGKVEDASSRREWQSQESRGETGTQPLAEQSDTGSVESSLGRVSHGLPAGLDFTRWPAGPGDEQYGWEPPRVLTERQKHRVARLKALGNSVIPHCSMYIALCIMAYENAKEGGAS